MLLHEHLDGSLRPATLIELADAAGIQLPADSPEVLRAYFKATAQGSLEQYLSCFSLTTACLQTPDALRRATFEAVEDLASDGVVYAELRFAPGLHLDRPTDALEAVLAAAAEATSGATIELRILVCALRDRDPISTLATAQLAACYRGPVVGFDLAGPEEGHPASMHRAALEHAATAGLGVTVHAGEAAGVGSIADALDAGASRLGHGVRIVDDITRTENGVVLGPVAERVLRDRVHLEVCPISNLDTGVFAAQDHPVMMLHRAGFSVGLNTDNRLISDTSLTAEEGFCADQFAAAATEIDAMYREAAASAFLPQTERARLLERLAARQ